MFPSDLAGNLAIPPSKSQSIRALLFGLLAKGTSTLTHLLPSTDVEAMIDACSQLGATIERHNESVEITGLAGTITGADNVIDAKNSGLIYRFLAGIAALSESPIVITGDVSIRNRRPIQPLLEALTQLGVEAFSLRKEGGAPIFIRGPIKDGVAIIEGADSQPVSSLLIASAFSSGPTEIYVTNPGEKPWINLTLEWLKRLGISYQADENFEYFYLEGHSVINAFSYHVPGDFSSAAFPLVAALVTGSEVHIENLNFSDAQGDKQLITYIEQMGATLNIEESKQEITVNPSLGLRGEVFDVNGCIDTLPILAVLGCFAEGTTEIRGAKIARYKESDRIHTIVRELQKMGANIVEFEDGLRVQRSQLKGAHVTSMCDHRIALALAVAGLAAQGETVIHDTACVGKTFPHFVGQMQKLGAKITIK